MRRRRRRKQPPAAHSNRNKIGTSTDKSTRNFFGRLEPVVLISVGGVFLDARVELNDHASTRCSSPDRPVAAEKHTATSSGR
uniref:Uncharacterized protein n=1 Tax=Arundo donax TaxID=35708 RepID=A0A0A8YW82_ARUDO